MRIRPPEDPAEGRGVVEGEGLQGGGGIGVPVLDRMGRCTCSGVSSEVWCGVSCGAEGGGHGPFPLSTGLVRGEGTGAYIWVRTLIPLPAAEATLDPPLYVS